MALKKISNLNRAQVPGIGTDKNIFVKSGDFNPVIDEINNIQGNGTAGPITTTTLSVGAITATSINATALGNVTGSGQEFTVLTTLTASTIVGTGAGTLGHASGVELVAAPGTGFMLQFIRAIAIYDFATAAYGGGGNDTSIRLGSGGAAITGVVTSANLLGAAGDKIVRFDPLSTAALPVSVNVPISINATTAWTQPGTAAGVCRIYTTYRVITTGL